MNETSLAGFREAGSARLSLGVQSLDPESLRFPRTGPHGGDAARAVALSAGRLRHRFRGLIYGLPDQTEERLRKDLESAAALGPDHFSCYQLTVHERTLFGRRKREGSFEEASEAAQSALFRLTHRVLESAGYEAYEVSNFARARRAPLPAQSEVLGPRALPRTRPRGSLLRRQHALVERALVLRLGAAASSRRDSRGGKRARSPDEELLLETLMLRLRTREGFDLDDVEEALRGRPPRPQPRARRDESRGGAPRKGRLLDSTDARWARGCRRTRRRLPSSAPSLESRASLSYRANLPSLAALSRPPG